MITNLFVVTRHRRRLARNDEPIRICNSGVLWKAVGVVGFLADCTTRGNSLGNCLESLLLAPPREGSLFAKLGNRLVIQMHNGPAADGCFFQ